MKIPKLNDTQLGIGNALWRNFLHDLLANNMRIVYDERENTVVLVPIELDDCCDEEEMISEEDYDEIMKRGAVNDSIWICDGIETSLSVPNK